MISSISPNTQSFRIPGVRVHPGYWIITLIFIITALNMVNSRGWIYGIPPFALAIVLPLISYLVRSGKPRVVELNSDEKTITQIFQRFGRVNKVTMDASRFSGVYLKIKNTRFPKACLMLQARTPSTNDVELVLTDTISDQRSGKLIPNDVAPKLIMEIISVLENEFNLVSRK